MQNSAIHTTGDNDALVVFRNSPFTLPTLFIIFFFASKRFKNHANQANQGSDMIHSDITEKIIGCAMKIIFLLFLPCLSFPSDVCYIPSRDYCTMVSKEIDSAKTSIHAVLYLFSLYPNQQKSQTLRLANSLISAHKRGVNVDVVLDKSEFSAGHGDPAEEGDNREAYDYLSAAGVRVGFADVPAIVHAKALIIDSQTVILGSANWSESALSRNVEASVLVNSKDVAKAVLQDVGNLHEKPLPVSDTAVVRLPLQFFSKNGIAKDMAKAADERAFDIYLFLYYLSKKQNKDTVVVQYDTMASHLGIAAMGREAYRRQITKVLKKLQDRYNCISVNLPYNNDARVHMKNIGDDSTQNAIALCAGYWDYGWNKRLPFAGKMMYALNTYYSAISKTRPQWSMAITTIMQRHGLGRSIVTLGTTALRRANLLDVAYDEFQDKNNNPRHSNVYTPLPLYNPEVVDSAWKNMEIKYGEQKTGRARAIAVLLYKDSDVDAVEKFILLEEKYGLNKIEQAIKLISQKEPDNPKRSVGYFIQTVIGLK